jgi:hypothetical protein
VCRGREPGVLRAVHQRAPIRRPIQAEDYAQGGRLARTVGSDEARDDTGGNLEAQVSTAVTPPKRLVNASTVIMILTDWSVG